MHIAAHFSSIYHDICLRIFKILDRGQMCQQRPQTRSFNKNICTRRPYQLIFNLPTPTTHSTPRGPTTTPLPTLTRPRTRQALAFAQNAVQCLEHQPQPSVQRSTPPFAVAVAVAAVRGHRLFCISPERRRPCAWHTVPPIPNDSTRPQRGHQ